MSVRSAAKSFWESKGIAAVGAVGGALLAGIAGVATGVIGPLAIARLAPDTRNVTPGIVCLEPRVPLSEFYAHLAFPPPEYARFTALQKQTAGIVVGVDLDARGFDGKDLQVDGVVLHAVSGSPVALRFPRQDRFLRGDADSIHRDPQVWVPLPTTPGRYLVRVDFWNGGDRLASQESSVFTLNPKLQPRATHLCTPKA